MPSQGLTSGAESVAPSDPLSQVLHHSRGPVDRNPHQQDQIAGDFSFQSGAHDAGVGASSPGISDANSPASASAVGLMFEEVGVNVELSEVQQHLQDSDTPASLTENTNDGPDLDGLGYPTLTEYAFEPNNPFLEPSMFICSLLTEAKDLLERNGSLSEVALLLEAAIQTGELGERQYEAWILLGETRSMDEREHEGMRALMEGVQRAESAGIAGAGMLSLAISFANESLNQASHHMLWRWLRAQFPTFSIHEDVEEAIRTHSTCDSHDCLIDAFMALARQQHDRGIIDPDVQMGLGVLFYIKAEYDRAKYCFECALSQRPQDYVLWNRLGSSLSNGNRPEEALSAYRKALKLRPTYTRAIYNVGVACLNMGAHKEAMGYFLSALESQESTGDRRTSDQLWAALKQVFLRMDRNDLAQLAAFEKSHAGSGIFRQHVLQELLST